MAKLNGDYFQIPNAIFNRCQNPYEIAVLSYLLRCRNSNTNNCFPSYKTIADNCHISRYQAILTIKNLKQLKLITVEAIPFKANNYTLTLTSQPHTLVNHIDQSTTYTSQPHTPTSQSHRLPLVNDVDPNKTNITRLTNKTNIYEHFKQFWEVYPRKEAKVKAEQAFKKIAPSEELLAIMLSMIERFKKTKQWQDKQLIPHPATWLNNKRWEDEISNESLIGGSNGTYRRSPKGTRLPDRDTGYTEPPYDPEVAAFAEVDRREREELERQSKAHL